MKPQTIIGGISFLMCTGLLTLILHRVFIDTDERTPNYARIGLFLLPAIVVVFALRFFQFLLLALISEIAGFQPSSDVVLLIARAAGGLTLFLSLALEGCVLGILAPREKWRTPAYLITALMVLQVIAASVFWSAAIFDLNQPGFSPANLTQQGMVLLLNLVLIAFGFLFHRDEDLRRRSVLLGPAWIAEGVVGAVSHLPFMFPAVLKNVDILSVVSGITSALGAGTFLLSSLGLLLFFLSTQRRVNG